jgi:hypothetical protein
MDKVPASKNRLLFPSHLSNHLIFVVKKQWDREQELEGERDEDELSELLDFDLDHSQIF